MLPELDATFENDSSLALMTDSSSLSSSFFSVDLSTSDLLVQRRSSIASCSTSTPPELFFTPSAGNTSPTTPMMADTNFQASYHKQFVKTATYLSNCHSMYHLVEDEESLHDCIWLDQTSTSHALSVGLPSMTHVPEMLLTEVNHTFYGGEHRGLNTVAANPALTKSMFGSNMTGSSIPTTENDNGILPWRSHRSHPPLETIEPSVTFQAPLTSSPRYKVEPSTPASVHISTSAILSSSPTSIISPVVLPSQHDIEELPYDAMEHALRFASSREHRANPDRLYRRRYERKRVTGATSKPKPVILSGKTGINCELVIAQNEFACSYSGCIDKNTGKQKRFKRQEHKKRHEKTVHEKAMHEAHKCWVPDCDREFSRTDNLKSHLRNTHSKKLGVRGNRYVATLDRTNEYYDPEWVGELDKHGYPIL
ncbi:uncharacterized protein A1O9_07008 [Exophiala aquamarina CBS 119918]|uniref:C2H2-type domain-containing protein n=1 Tax=Exophiala aquamarina CBS 119918 TaxID=1182545 RepID=A0A072PC18_9EURO|nr:uncharacterized protein A1O9_07008 [Exophiala aquamarina CBS 119918]KEF56818.1 hypothetical protein A1O9_07008 [Exophiala aquamarina CBS 119918]